MPVFKKLFKFFLLAGLFATAAGLSAYLSLTLLIKSENAVVVPDLQGKNLLSALETLTDLGLNIKIKGSEYNEHVPKHHIIFQDPEPGAEIKKDRDVRIIVSKGTPMVVMPNLKQLPLPQARIILEENDLNINALSFCSHPRLESNHIISQAPWPGRRIPRGSSVDLLVSTGPAPVAREMPNLIGLSMDEAILILERYHLQVGDLQTPYQPRKPVNTIVAQEPEFGTQVTEGTGVQLSINRKPGRKHERPAMGSGVGLFRYRVPEGFLRKRIRVRVDFSGISENFYDAWTKPGQEIWVLVPRYTNATVFVYENNVLIQSRVFDAW